MLHAVLIALAATTAAPPTWEELLHAREELSQAVRGEVVNAQGEIEVAHPEGRIPQYAWDDPEKVVRTFTRRELVEHLVGLNNEAVSADNPGIAVDRDRVLDSIVSPRPVTDEDWRFWTGLNVAVQRNEEHPDDAYWYPVCHVGFRDLERAIRLPLDLASSNVFEVQMVEWYGADPRVGFNAQDKDGLWGYDPKRAVDDATVTRLREKAKVIRAGEKPSDPLLFTYTDDGQGGHLGVNVGFAFTPDDSAWHGILWISYKEAYLEFVNRETGLRIAQGMNGQRYTWNIRR